jgi:hypothetical protein
MRQVAYVRQCTCRTWPLCMLHVHALPVTVAAVPTLWPAESDLFTAGPGVTPGRCVVRQYPAGRLQQTLNDAGHRYRSHCTVESVCNYTTYLTVPLP